MNTKMISSPLCRYGIALALAMILWSPAHAQSAKPEAGDMMMADRMKAQCEEMKQQKQKMKADMKVQNDELTAHVAAMNRAPEAEKLDIMAAVVTHMLEQRIAMDARKAKMEEAMMQHMMQHMQMGKESMKQCPMMKEMEGMKEMKGMDENSESPKEYHEAPK